MPTVRSVVSGACWTDSMARFAVAGKAENTSPSMTKTRPSATTKSDIGHRRAMLFTFGYLAPWVCAAPGCIGAGLPAEAGPVLPLGATKKRKNSESGFSNIRVSLCWNAVS